MVYCLVGVHTAFWQDFAYLSKRELVDMRDMRPPAWAMAAFFASKLAYAALVFLVPLAVLRAYPGRACRHVMMARAKWSSAR